MEQSGYNWGANVATSSVGGGLMAVIGLLGWVLREKCKHMTSRCDCGICTLTSQEDDIESQRQTQRLKVLIREIQSEDREGGTEVVD